TARTCCRGILADPIALCAPNLKSDAAPHNPCGRSPGVLALPHLCRRPSRTCSSGDVGIGFRNLRITLRIPPMSHRPPHPLQNRVDCLHVAFFRMELPTSPTTEMAEFLMPRPEDDLQELLIA